MPNHTFEEMLQDARDFMQARSLDAPTRSIFGHRAAFTYVAVLDQFHAERSQRYQPQTTVGRDGKPHTKTFCNVFCSDVTRAMDAEIPHVVDGLGFPALLGADGTHELNANQTVHHLSGGAWGWHELTAEGAFTRAQHGYPTVAAWQNEPGRPGHIAMVEPLPPHPGIFLAQAGATCGRMLPLRAAFGDKPVRFFTHE